MEFLELFAWMKVGDVATLSIFLLIGMFVLLAIGMPLGFASAFLAVAVIVMKFGPEASFGRFGSGPMSVLAQAVYRQMTNYVLISVPLFIFMASLLERSGIAKDMYDALNQWLSRTRGGIAIVTSIMAVIMAAMSGIIGGEVVLLRATAARESASRILFKVNLMAATMVFFTGVWFWESLSLQAFLLIVAMGPVAIVGQVCNIRAFRLADATALVPVRYSGIVFAAVFGILIFGEWPDASAIIGAVLIAGGAMWLALRPAR